MILRISESEEFKMPLLKVALTQNDHFWGFFHSNGIRLRNYYDRLQKFLITIDIKLKDVIGYGRFLESPASEY